MEFDEWLAIGRDAGWISRDVCGTHYGVPTTEAEDENEECVHILRLYPDAETKAAVEKECIGAAWPASA